MSDLLAISFDAAASPTITLEPHDHMAAGHISPMGWGFGWYPRGESAAMVIKDPLPTGDTVFSRILRDWEHFRTNLFLCHIRSDTRQSSQENMHPFCRSYAGRDWLFAHDGQLNAEALRQFSLGSPVFFEPTGQTDSEYIFCWLMAQLQRANARQLDGIQWTALHQWFEQLNALGSLNLIMTDGQDLIAYRDRQAESSLYLCRCCPPHRHALKNRALSLQLDNSLDNNRSMVLVATHPLSEHAWSSLAPGEMVVVRLGQVIWQSTPGKDESAASAPSASHASPMLRRDSEPAPQLMREASVRMQADNSEFHQAGPSPSESVQSRVLRVTHETLYQYDAPVEHSTHVFRLRPVHDVYQEVLEHTLDISPQGMSYTFEDVFGNQTVRMKVREPYTELRVLAQSRIRIRDRNASIGHRTTTLPLVWMPWQRQMMMPYLLPPELPESQLRELSDFATSFATRQQDDLVETLNDINRTIRRDFAYVSESTTLETTPFEIYVHRRGVCQDFANLFICLARLLGVPARYRIGYIYTGANYDNSIQSEASHAWLEVYLPWEGWRGYDPTNGCLVNLDHVCVAAGRNYIDATPTSGTIYKGGRGERLSVSVRVEDEGAAL